VGLTARPEGERLRLVDTATQKKLLWNDELEPALREAEERAAQDTAGRRAAEEKAAAAEEKVAQEAAARREAEERIRALTEELARLRNQPGS